MQTCDSGANVLSDSLDGVSLTNDASADDAAKDSAPAANFFSQALSDFVHEAARRAGHGDLKQKVADSEAGAGLQPVHIDSLGRDVLSDGSRRKLQSVERFFVHDQNLAFAPGATMGRP